MKKILKKIKSLSKSKKILILVSVIFILLIFCCGILSLIPFSNSNLQSTITPTVTLTATPTVTPTITFTQASTKTLIPTIEATQIFTEMWPTDATAKCNDGSFSNSQTRQGTCKGHSGVLIWKIP
jgi:hypothetical protein